MKYTAMFSDGTTKTRTSDHQYTVAAKLTRPDGRTSIVFSSTRENARSNLSKDMIVAMVWARDSKEDQEMARAKNAEFATKCKIEFVELNK